MSDPVSNSDPGGTTWAVVVGTVLGLDVLLHVPSLLLGALPADPLTYLSDPLRVYYLFSLDLFGLVCLLALVPYTDERSWVRLAVVGSFLFLFAYQTYDAVVVSMLHRSPIFYADAPHLVGAVYLLLNGGLPGTHMLGLGAAVGGLGLLGWVLPSLVRRLHRRVRLPLVRRVVLASAVGVSVLVGAAVATDRGIDRQTYRSVCFSTTECVVRNVQASISLNHELLDRSSGAADSTYVGYDALQWAGPPSLYLVVVESYGSVLAAPPHREHYDRLMTRLGDSLTASGWHAATAHSEAPVFGGLSWLSVASLLLGTPVDHQPTFDVLRTALPRYPHLVRFLQQQGYRTGTLQASVRARPGLTVENLYGFDRTLYFRDLGYRGPAYGWGIVPDQYSLVRAHELFVDRVEAPFFLFFETVTSHGPWDRSPPPLMADPMTLNNPQLSFLGRPASPTRPDTLSQVEQLSRLIRYDWRVLVDYLRSQAPPNSLVVVVGDHQPYFAETRSRATPLHVLSREEELVRRFEDYGFVSGLPPTPAADTLHHAGLYSLLVRVLTAHDRATRSGPADSVPPYRPRGVERAALLPTRL